MPKNPANQRNVKNYTKQAGLRTYESRVDIGREKTFPGFLSPQPCGGESSKSEIQGTAD